MKPGVIAAIVVIAFAGYVAVRNSTHHHAPKAVQVIKKAAPLPAPVVVAKPVPPQAAQAKPHKPAPLKARPAAPRIAKPLAVVPPAPRAPVAEGYGGRLFGHPVERDRQ